MAAAAVPPMPGLSISLICLLTRFNAASLPMAALVMSVRLIPALSSHVVNLTPPLLIS